jgi:hypothetical protein
LNLRERVKTAQRNVSFDLFLWNKRNQGLKFAEKWAKALFSILEILWQLGDGPAITG